MLKVQSFFMDPLTYEVGALFAPPPFPLLFWLYSKKFLGNPYLKSLSKLFDADAPMKKKLKIKFYSLSE